MAKSGVDAVDRALSLLEAFNRQRQSMTLTELAEATGMYKSTVLRLAASLERFQFLVRREDGRFAIGQATWRLGLLYSASFDLEPLVRPELIRLVDAVDETASLYVREGDLRVCLYRENSRRSARHHLDEGVALPLSSGASGHVLLAYQADDENERRNLLPRGYAISIGERDPDLAAVAVPVLDQDGKFRGALSLSGIVTRFTEANIELMLKALKESAARLRETIPGIGREGSA
ncbi:IclR family transcriptional regulator [Allopusillimonas ginsengisoli]|nr:IclR family transcriptional regulator [Allopusillimonas ginsengisoli]